MEKHQKSKCDFCASLGIDELATRTYIEDYERFEYNLCSHCANFIFNSREPNDMVCFPQGLEEKRLFAIIKELKEYREKIDSKLKRLTNKIGTGQHIEY